MCKLVLVHEKLSDLLWQCAGVDCLISFGPAAGYSVYIDPFWERCNSIAGQLLCRAKLLMLHIITGWHILVLKPYFIFAGADLPPPPPAEGCIVSVGMKLIFNGNNKRLQLQCMDAVVRIPRYFCLLKKIMWDDWKLQNSYWVDLAVRLFSLVFPRARRHFQSYHRSLC